jgi:hypothetical protein
MLACVAYGAATSGFLPNEMDSLSYVFQARLFAQGRVTAAAPPSMGMSPSQHVNVADGRWYSKYPPGQAMALAVAIKVGAPWMVPVLSTGFAIVLLYLIVLETYGPATAKIAVVFGIISPATYVLGSMLFSEALSRLLIGAYLYALLVAFRTGALRWAIVSGICLGMDFNTRPLAALAIGGTATGVMACFDVARRGWSSTVRIVGAVVLASLCLATVTFGWNYATTGQALTNTFNVTQPEDRLGFGPRSGGYVPSFRVEWTPIAAARRLVFRTIPAVIQNSLGVGYYEPAMYEALAGGELRSRLLVVSGAAGFLIPVALLAFAFKRGGAFRETAFFTALALTGTAAYTLYWFEGSTFGSTPTNTRYYAECTMFGLLPLMAYGFEPFRSWLVSVAGRRYRVCAVTLCLLCGVSYTYNASRSFAAIRGRFSTTRAQWRALSSIATRAVVFFPHAVFMPVGDYPSQPLEDARVVTFRLTCAPQWGLSEGTLSEAYDRYFSGREAFVWIGGKGLQRVDASYTGVDSSPCVR